MKVSCIPICFFEDLIRTRRMPLAQWIQMAADVGLDGIEVYRPYLDIADGGSPEALAEEIDRAGLLVSMYTSYGDLAAASEDERQRQLELLRADIDTAVALGTRIVRVTAGRWPTDCGPEEALRNVAECLRRSLDYAQEQGVALAIEDHPEIGTRISDFVAILSMVDDDRLKVNLDTSNPMESGDSPVALTELVKDRVVHVHASDRNEQLEHQVVGEGCVPFREVFAVLQSAGFDGWVSMEAGGSKGKQGIVEGLSHVREAWRAGLTDLA